jgi:hypothetical protein
MIFLMSSPFRVVPAKAGIQKLGVVRLDLRLCGNDGLNWENG